MSFPKSIKITDFKIFLEELRRQDPFGEAVLYMDNLSVHRSKLVIERIEELGFHYVFGPPYSPDFNGIENVFGIVKMQIKKRRLASILMRKKFQMKEEIDRAFRSVEIEKVAACLNRSLRLL